MLFRFMFLAAISLALAACGPAMFESRSSLSHIAQRITPIAEGDYLLRQDSDSDRSETRLTFMLTEGEIYDVNDGEDPFARASFYGPVGGFYLLELEKKIDEQVSYATIIARIESDRMRFADPSAYDLMATVLFEALDLTPIEGGYSQVTALTDNAYLNWSLFQELIIRYRDRIKFDYYLDPVSKESS